MNKIDVARVAYEVSRAIKAASGDESVTPWHETAPPDQNHWVTAVEEAVWDPTPDFGVADPSFHQRAEVLAFHAVVDSMKGSVSGWALPQNPAGFNP